jgi:hypothetical protein
VNFFDADRLAGKDCAEVNFFVLNGQKLKLGKIFPDGITIFSTISNVPVSGTSDFPVGLPYAGSAIAIGPEPPTDSGSNEHR